MFKKTIIIGFRETIEAIKTNSLADMDVIKADRILVEMITQCMDFLLNSSADNNLFKNKNYIPYPILTLIPGEYWLGDVTRDKLRSDFTKLYVDLREKLEKECLASKVVERYGKFNYIFKDLRSNLIVIEHVSDEEMK